jgi:hypothetical protein
MPLAPPLVIPDNWRPKIAPCSAAGEDHLSPAVRAIHRRRGRFFAFHAFPYLLERRSGKQAAGHAGLNPNGL